MKTKLMTFVVHYVNENVASRSQCAWICVKKGAFAKRDIFEVITESAFLKNGAMRIWNCHCARDNCIMRRKQQRLWLACLHQPALTMETFQQSNATALPDIVGVFSCEMGLKSAALVFEGNRYA